MNAQGRRKEEVGLIEKTSDNQEGTESLALISLLSLIE